MNPRALGVAGQAPAPAELPVPAADERALVEALLRRDRKAAAHFVAAHIDAVYGFVRHRLAPRGDLVDDVVQEVFLAALNGLTSFRGESSLRTWLFAIARHKIEDIYRQRLRAPEALEALTADHEALSEMVPLDERIDTARAQDKARRVLARMPERYGLMLLWRYWHQRSARDMARAIGTTEKGVERALARARARFREIWSRE